MQGVYRLLSALSPDEVEIFFCFKAVHPPANVCPKHQSIEKEINESFLSLIVLTGKPKKAGHGSVMPIAWAWTSWMGKGT